MNQSERDTVKDNIEARYKVGRFMTWTFFLALGSVGVWLVLRGLTNASHLDLAGGAIFIFAAESFDWRQAYHLRSLAMVTDESRERAL